MRITSFLIRVNRPAQHTACALAESWLFFLFVRRLRDDNLVFLQFCEVGLLDAYETLFNQNEGSS